MMNSANGRVMLLTSAFVIAIQIVSSMARLELVNLAYKKYEPCVGGDSKLSPVIFLHGATLSKENWLDLPQIVADKTKRTAYAVDSRNHGDSPWNDVFNFDINVDDLLHFMDSLSISKAVLVGHSMGGITGIRTALRSPERVEKLFVEDTIASKLDQELLNMAVGFNNLFKEAIKQIPKETPEEDVPQLLIDYILAQLPEPVREIAKNNTNNADIMPFKRDSDGNYQFKANLDVITEAFKNKDTLMTEPEGSYEGPAYFIYGMRMKILSRGYSPKLS